MKKFTNKGLLNIHVDAYHAEKLREKNKKLEIIEKPSQHITRPKYPYALHILNNKRATASLNNPIKKSNKGFQLLNNMEKQYGKKYSGIAPIISVKQNTNRIGFGAGSSNMLEKSSQAKELCKAMGLVHKTHMIREVSSLNVKTLKIIAKSFWQTSKTDT